MKIGVAHPGTQHSWQTSYAFQQKNLLEWYATGFYYKKNHFPDRLISYLPSKIKKPLDKELFRRRFELINDDNILRGSYTELIERQVGKLISTELQSYLIERRHKKFPIHLEQAFSQKPVDIIWGPHEGTSAIRNIKSTRKIKYILDQPIGHFSVLNEIMAEEYDKNPIYFKESPEFYSNDKVASLNEAIELSDNIVVGCPYAANTLISEGANAEKIEIIEYGSGNVLNNIGGTSINELKENTPINFIFVGTIEPRKGIAYLIDAFKYIDPKVAKLTLVGLKNVPDEILASLPKSVEYAGQVLRSEVSRYLDDADCFVFPSLFEGGGIVLYEAAGRGLPIIQTKNSAIVAEHEKTGIVLESPECLADEVESLIADRERLNYFQYEAKKRSFNRSWEDYREDICKFVKENVATSA